MADTAPDVDRARVAFARVIESGGGDTEFEAAVAALRELPPADPVRARLSAALVALLQRRDVATASMRWLDELVDAAEQHPPADPGWPRQRTGARGLALAYRLMHGMVPDHVTALRELDEFERAAGADPMLRAVAASARMGWTVAQAATAGDESLLRRLPQELPDLSGLVGDNPQLAQLNHIMRLAATIVTANQAQDDATMWQTMDQLMAAAEQLPAGHGLRAELETAEARMRPLRGLLEGPTGATVGATEEQLSAMRARADRPGATEADRMLDNLSLGGALLAGGRETDEARVEEAVVRMRHAVEFSGADHSMYPFCLQSLGLALYQRSEVTARTDGLGEAAEVLERSREALGGPHHPQWSFVNDLLSIVRQRLGDTDQARQSRRLSQRGYAWRALLESDAAGVRIAVRNAAYDAVALALQCLQANKPGEALRALDAGRGLMLFAATGLREVPAHLTALGLADLAAAWTAPGGPTPLARREALTALSQAESTAGLLDPPGLSEIQSALALLDADALVYLMPGDGPQPGFAVIAPVDRAPAYLALPDLQLGEGAADDIERYLQALARRSRDVVPEQPAERDFAGSMAGLCDWAWRAAVGPVLERYFGIMPGARDRPTPHVVLLPMGDLARVPWAAARRPDGVHAVQLAAFSQAVSARLLCDNAGLAPVAPTATGLVVGDPDTGDRAQPLDAARREAYAVRQAFYLGARYVGRRPDGSVSPSGAGTADQVRAWLADPSRTAGSMLHLACHGDVVGAGADAKAFVLLAKGPGGDELNADELIDLLARVPERRLGTVVLAACNTGRYIHGYDEAYSLGTAFLAAGARTVLSTQWRVPDAATSSLMFMFHHYLRREQLPPWQALRRAQMWMLDPGRRAPEHMPAQLRPDPSAGDPAAVVAWAGFVHYGH